ncbi:hypothetical protein ES705_21192 [subsurface metagenome]
MKISVYFLLPESGNSFSEQLHNCFEQLHNFTERQNIPSGRIITLTFFVATESRDQYQNYKATINSYIRKLYGTAQPAVACVAQAPENGNYIGLEVFLGHGLSNKIIYKQFEDTPYAVVEHNGSKEIYASGLTGLIKGDIYENSNMAFTLMEKILNAENLNFSNIVRQWNFIENITHIPDKRQNYQHYQIFNDVRSDYYNKSKFIHGYPSATGIGTDICGVVINFIAISAAKNMKIVPVMNPGQIDAHKYSQKVLVGSEVYKREEKSSPKFERGKLVRTDEGTKIYISGTAAIIGENTVFPTDVEKQTMATIKNIKKLVESESISKLDDIQSVEKINYSYVRSYVKHKKDIDIVKRLCEKHIRSECFQYLISDICRDNLLVEIEGLIEF